MLDRSQPRRGGGDPYDAAGRRAVLTVALAGSVLLVLLALRAGYLAARAMGWPTWPVAGGCALAALGLPSLAYWVMSREK